ncbi:acyltransferase [Rhizobium sp. XQZ8]|uniref:acyltransferase family protein n=1 Tax=Rhizobium populisoli TaxID=2859785 RepID=UPI001C68648F|nr:acyltransferase [Rhizobium populisoli]MBW6423068.1 acyltransferase [Rhizobium populisoli]
MKHDHIPYLDGWRGLAIAAVLLGHFGEFSALNLGPFGVELFFVLSGRLMAEILIRRQTPLKLFFWRRFSRIFPALFAFCLAMLLVSVAASVVGKHVPKAVGLPEFLAAVFFLMNYTTSLLGMTTVLEHIWSLSVEEHSYAILAVIAVLSSRNLKTSAIIAIAVAAAMMLSGILQGIYTNQSEHELYWRTDVRAASVFFSFGFYLLLKPWLEARAGNVIIGLLTPACLVGAVVLNLNIFPIWLKYSVATLLLAVAINALDVALPVLRRALSLRVMVYLGTLSYSLYLWQQPFYLAADMIGVALAVSGTVIVGLCSFYIIEQPCRRYLNNMVGRRPAASLDESGERAAAGSRA